MRVCEGEGGEEGLGGVRPNRAATRLAGRGDLEANVRGCPPYATRAVVASPRGGGRRGSGGRPRSFVAECWM